MRHVITPFVNLLMFLSPVFFPASALSPMFRPYMFLNPITFVIEESRNVAMQGLLPEFGPLVIYYVAALLVAWIGLVCFTATRHAFADVV